MDAAPEPPPPSQRADAMFWFARGLALVWMLAFVQLRMQVFGLIGSQGVLPAAESQYAQLGFVGALGLAPSLLWLWPSDWMIEILCDVGIVLSTLAFAGVAPGICFLGCFVAYLSLVQSGDEFFSLQWDTLLLEVTFLALLAVPWRLRPARVEPSIPAVGLLRLLCFRLMWFSGFVKLASGDPTWRDLSALTFHYWTQPLPNPLSGLFARMPDSLHAASCVIMMVIELLMPFFVFGPRRLRIAAFVMFQGLMAILAVSGNYGFFQLLSMVLFLTMLDDEDWRVLLPARVRERIESWAPEWPIWRYTTGLGAVAAVPLVILAVARGLVTLQGRDTFVAEFGADGLWVVAQAGNLGVVNGYGLFANMTEERPELIVEGSADGELWLRYEFPYKPGDIDSRPTQVAPYMPRLDWQMWFAALRGPCKNSPFLRGLADGLIDGRPEVLALMGHNPFRNDPPEYIRFVKYHYAFTGDDFGEMGPDAEVGRIWTRRRDGVQCGPYARR